jgi:hypothetical protein
MQPINFALDWSAVMMGGSPTFNEQLKEQGFQWPCAVTIFRCVVCNRRVSIESHSVAVKEAARLPVACMGCILSARGIPIPEELAKALEGDL